MLRLDLERCPYVVADSSRSLAIDPLRPLGLLQSRRIWSFSDRSEHSETREQCATIHHSTNSACTRGDCRIMN